MIPRYKPGDRVRFRERTEIDTTTVRVTVPPSVVLLVLASTDGRVKLMLGEGSVWVSDKFVTREG